MKIDISQVTSKFFETLSEIAKKEKHIYVGLAGGSSLDSWYAKMIGFVGSRMNAEEKNLLKRVHWCMVDERVVEPENHASNYAHIHTSLIKHLKLRNLVLDKNIHTIDHLNRAPERHYSNRVPRIDIGMYGVGEDGHVASLFPHHPLLESRANKYLWISDSPKPPAHRITMSPEMIRRSHTSFVFFMGNGKTQAYENFQDASQDEFDCPVKLTQEAKNHYIIRK